MKKVYLSLFIAGFAASASYAQLNTKPYVFGEVNEDSIKPTQTQNEGKALGVEIWADEFNDGTNWTIDNDGQPGGAFGWSIDAVNDGWWSTAGITSTSGGGFAELSNGDAQAGTQEINVTYTMTSVSLDIPNLPGNTANTDQATLQFEQYGAIFNDEQTVEISTDGGNTWEIMRANRDFYSVLSAGGGSAMPNPDLISINLAPYITGNANNVQIRFVWTTAFPGNTQPGAWITYGWYIDDVRIFTNPDNDITAFDSYWGTAGLNYSRIPTSQIAPIDFATFVFNNGLNMQTGVRLEVDVNNGLWTGSSTPTGVQVGASDSIGTTTQFTPAATPGTNYAFTWEVTQNETDDVPANNMLMGDSFDVTEFDYAMDDDVIDGSTGNGGFGYEKGNFYDVWADETAYAIQIKLANTTEVGSTVYGKVYRWDPSNATTFADALFFEQQTDFYEVTQADLAGGLITLPLIAPTNLTAANNTYFVVAVTDGDGGATDDVQLATSGISPTGFSYFYAADDDAWYLQPQTPIVRLSFDPAYNIGLDELSSLTGLNVFPNPASDEVNVSFNINDASDVTVEVLDLTGKVMETVVNAANVTGVQNAAINIAGYAAGMYVINVTTNEGSIQRKFVKK